MQTPNENKLDTPIEAIIMKKANGAANMRHHVEVMEEWLSRVNSPNPSRPIEFVLTARMPKPCVAVAVAPPELCIVVNADMAVSYISAQLHMEKQRLCSTLVELEKAL